jgi:serine/threonine protein kinase
LALAKTFSSGSREFAGREEADATLPRDAAVLIAGRHPYAAPEAVTRVVGRATMTDSVSKSLPRPVSGPRAANRARCSISRQLAYRAMADFHVGLLEDVSGGETAVAVKRFDRSVAGAGVALARACPDAWLGYHLEHPNLMRVLELLPAPDATLGAFEYPPTESLAGLLRDGNRLPVRILVAVLRDVLLALEAAHSASDSSVGPLEIVHATIAPEAVLIGADGITRLTQFGVARRLDSGQGPFGRLGYAAPEQVFDQRADPSSDVFAVGVLLWEGLAGRRLIEGDSPVDAMLRFLSSGASSAAAVNPRVSRELDAVVQRALEPTPERRFRSARAFADALTAASPPAEARDVAHYVEGVGWAALERQRAIVLDLQSGRVPLEKPSGTPRQGVRSGIVGMELEEPTIERGRLFNVAAPQAAATAPIDREELTAVDGPMRAPLSPDLADAAPEVDVEALSHTLVDKPWALPTLPAAQPRFASPLASTLRRTVAPVPRRPSLRLFLLGASLMFVFVSAFGAGRLLRHRDAGVPLMPRGVLGALWSSPEPTAAQVLKTTAPAPLAAAAPATVLPQAAASSPLNVERDLPVLRLEDLPPAISTAKPNAQRGRTQRGRTQRGAPR